MLRSLCFALAGLAVAYLGVCALLYVFQRSFIYYPRPRSLEQGVSILTLHSGGERVLVSARPRESERAVLYFGGNAEDVSLNLPGFLEAFPGAAIYLLHYRGYGGSSGRPSEKALFSDALALFDLAYARHPKVLVIGRSLGSGVGVYTASRRPVDRLVLVTPFDSLRDIAARQFPVFPVRWLLLDPFESNKYAPQVTAPTAIIAAGEDEVIPLASSRLLHSRFRPGVATFTVIPGEGHNTISENPEYLRLLTGGR